MDTLQYHDAQGRRIAFRHLAGDGPTIVFLPGYKSDMAGSKATAVLDWAGRQPDLPIHFAAAAALFVLLGIVAWQCACHSLSYLPADHKHREPMFRRAYRVLAALALAATAAVAYFGMDKLGRFGLLLVLLCCVLGVAWLVVWALRRMRARRAAASLEAVVQTQGDQAVATVDDGAERGVFVKVGGEHAQQLGQAVLQAHQASAQQQHDGGTGAAAPAIGGQGGFFALQLGQAGGLHASAVGGQGDQAGFEAHMAAWPVDVQAHLKRLAMEAFRA